MSVVEQLEKFRYTTVTRECPLSLVRSLDVARLRIERPDLQQMKLLTSSISDCCLPSLSDLQQLKPAEILHLLSTYQAVLQFSLHSQSVLRDQVVAKQNALAAEKITAQHLSALELKLSAAKKKLEDATAEAQALRLRVHALEKQVGELTTANILLDRELEYHRTMVARAHCGGEPKAEHQQQKQDDVPKENPIATAELLDARERKARKSRAHPPADFSSSTSLDSSPRRKPSASRTHGAAEQRFVDWQSFTTLLLQQQQLALQSTKPSSAAAPPPSQPPPTSTALDAVPHQHAPPPQHVQAPPAAQPSSIGDTEAILAAVRSGLREHQNEFLKQTQETIANVELGLTNRILKSQEEQRAHHEALVKHVEQREERWSTALQSVSKQVATLREEQEQQMKLLKADVSAAVSSISRHASIPLGHAPASGAPAIATRSASPSILPPLPLAQVQAELANTSATGGKAATNAAAGASPVATPGSAFGPRLLSSAGSNGDATSDEDNDGDGSPYVPISRQTATEACRHCRQRFPVGELAVHETNCELRVVSCKQCKMSVVVRLLPTHKCASAESLPASGDKSGVADASFQESSFNASSIQPAAVTRKPSSQMLKDTQDELQRLLDEDAAEEARRAAAADAKKQ